MELEACYYLKVIAHTRYLMVWSFFRAKINSLKNDRTTKYNLPLGPLLPTHTATRGHAGPVPAWLPRDRSHLVPHIAKHVTSPLRPTGTGTPIHWTLRYEHTACRLHRHRDLVIPVGMRVGDHLDRLRPARHDEIIPAVAAGAALGENRGMPERTSA